MEKRCFMIYTVTLNPAVDRQLLVPETHSIRSARHRLPGRFWRQGFLRLTHAAIAWNASCTLGLCGGKTAIFTGRFDGPCHPDEFVWVKSVNPHQHQQRHPHRYTTLKSRPGQQFHWKPSKSCSIAFKKRVQPA
jgi:hypothetical protein